MWVERLIVNIIFLVAFLLLKTRVHAPWRIHSWANWIHLKASSIRQKRMMRKSIEIRWWETHFACPITHGRNAAIGWTEQFGATGALDLVVHFTPWFLDLVPVYCSNWFITYHLFHVHTTVKSLASSEKFWSFLIIFSYLSELRSLKLPELSKNQEFLPTHFSSFLLTVSFWLLKLYRCHIYFTSEAFLSCSLAHILA